MFCEWGKPIFKDTKDFPKYPAIIPSLKSLSANALSVKIKNNSERENKETMDKLPESLQYVILIFLLFVLVFFIKNYYYFVLIIINNFIGNY